jgi:hypothetical protein
MTRRQMLIVAAALVGAFVLFGQGAGRYIGGISPSGPKGAGGADGASALPRGYRSDPPYGPNTSRSS